MRGPSRKLSWPSGRLLTALSVGVNILALEAYLFVSSNEPPVVNKSVDQVVANRQSLVGHPMRVEGMLVHGSMAFQEAPCEYRFALERGGETLQVRHPACILPDTFRDLPDVPVSAVLEGELLRDGTFRANQVLAKGGSKYTWQRPSPQPELHGPRRRRLVTRREPL